MTQSANRPVFLVRPPGSERLTPGIKNLRVLLDLNVEGRRGPHKVGKAEVMPDGVLAVWITQNSPAGRDARALLSDDVLDVVLSGPRPIVLLTVL